jgi:hypothetical protein
MENGERFEPESHVVHPQEGSTERSRFPPLVCGIIDARKPHLRSVP